MKTYLVTGINDEEWEEILSCIKFSTKFADNTLKEYDLKILKNIKIKEIN